MSKYAVYQYGYAIFGIGVTREEAIADANNYGEFPPDLPDYNGENVSGNSYVIEITDRLYEEVDRIGGVDVCFERMPGYPYVWDLVSNDESQPDKIEKNDEDTT